jgi:P27 family predicted phage terminase small subunit
VCKTRRRYRTNCPAHLDENARKKWDDLSEKLLRVGLLTELDGDGLAAYCQVWSRWIEAEEHLRNEPMVYKTEKRYPVMNPWWFIANKSMEQMRVWSAAFGLSPESRTRLHVLPTANGNEKDPAESYF